MHRAGIFLVLIAALAAVPASAQSVIAAQAGLVHHIEGTVSLAGQLPFMRAALPLQTAEGRAEVLLSPGVFLRVDEHSTVRMISNSVAEPKFQLLSGAVIVDALELPEGEVKAYAGRSTVSLRKAGVYRLEAEPAALKVLDGKARVETDGEEASAGKGKLLPLDGTGRPHKFDRDESDAFDKWSDARSEQYRARYRERRYASAPSARVVDASASRPAGGLDSSMIPKPAGAACQRRQQQ